MNLKYSNKFLEKVHVQMLLTLTMINFLYFDSVGNTKPAQQINQ